MGERTFTIAEKRAALQRELKMRRRVYPKWVRERAMTEDQADHEIAVLEAILGDYPDPQGSML